MLQCAQNGVYSLSKYTVASVLTSLEIKKNCGTHNPNPSSDFTLYRLDSIILILSYNYVCVEKQLQQFFFVELLKTNLV